MAHALTTDSSVELCAALKRFGEVAALAGVDLTVRSGEFLTLLGPSGCGKTTSLRVIAGFELLTDGDVRIGGESVAAMPPNKRPVNTVFQNYALFPHLSTYENVAFGLRLRRCSSAEIDRRVRQALDLVQLSGLHQRRPRQLSGGQQQRVALARALVLEPRVLLLDEPLGALDLKLRREMQFELKALQRRLGMTFIYVTHDQEEAFALSDRVAVMNRGRLVQLGEPAAIYEDPADAWVANFVGDANLLPVTDLDQLTAGAPESLGCPRSAMDPASAGQPLFLMVRPERVRLEPISADGARYLSSAAAGAALSGRIVDQIFAGPLHRWVVELPNGRRLVAAASNTGDGYHRLSLGSDVRVSWRSGDARILAAGDLSA